MIVECKCQKYKFDIPNLEIPEEGKMVRCGFCDEEWLYQSMEPLKDLNPSEEILIPKEKKKNSVKKKNYTTLLSFIFFIIITSGMPLYAGPNRQSNPSGNERSIASA